MKPFTSFKDLSLPVPLGRALDKMNFINPTPIQTKAIPVALDGKDILGTAQTGTGKTGAFGIPMLTYLSGDLGKNALILAPTRELAAQIHNVLRDMSRGLKVHGALIIGGESFGRQVNELDRGADYIVATPGRLNDHLVEGTVDLSFIGFLVLDEVDRMLDMGFAPQIKKIMKFLPPKRQTLLFSATLPNEIVNLARTLLNNPVRVAVGAPSEKASQITESVVHTTNEGKSALILSELTKRQGRVLIFTRTKSRADRLAKFLQAHEHSVVSLHGGKSQAQRKYALEAFRKGTHRIMVATDLAGRGIDVTDIEHVINYDVPLSREDYIHRIGRTGRFGKQGSALTFLVGNHEGELFIQRGKRRK